ncbi:MAG: RNase H family protein [Corynebacterium sp.]|nr:RNase H family protein [Corynebacterium sp.]
MKPQPIDLELLVGNQSRTYKTRQVTGDMVARPIHVAIALWDIPYKSAEDSTMDGWVIAVDSPRARFIRRGRMTKGDVVRKVLKELSRALKNLNGEAWIVTGRRQATLRQALEERNYLVTGSFSEKNRAGKRAAGQRKRDEQMAKRQAKKTGEYPTDRETTPIPTTPTHWWPSFHRTTVPAGASLRIATDASSDTVTKGSICFVADNGDYQLATHETTASTDELELECITMALNYLTEVSAASAVIESDSAAALEAVDYILSGKKIKRGKPWRGIDHRARMRFQGAHQELSRTCDISIRRVLGHAGDPLNQAADQIAYMGLRAIAHPQEEAEPTLKQGIENSLNKMGKADRERSD